LGAQPPILWFDQLRREHVDLAGGKGANLGELTAAGIPVPPGFVVTTDAYTRYLDDCGIAVELRAALDGIDCNDADGLARAAERARALILLAAEPACADHVAAAYERLGGGRVAVRSSATAEDSADASFAGQQSTYLNIEGPARVVEAVRACWASLFEPRAIAYRAQCGIDHASSVMAVPVQRMVESSRSGVAFSVDPVTHNDGVIVIEAVRGLGEALVSGAITPDMYAVDKETGAVLERTLVEQRQELAYAGTPAGGDALEPNAWRDLPAVLRTRPKLNDAEAARLAEIVARVERHYGAPQDIEWAEAGGEFYILQARPITTLQHAV
jgi:pyruvate,water dikinase